MSSCSDEEYFYKLDNMVFRSTKYLRQVFRTRWKVESGEDWKDELNYIQERFSRFLVQHGGKILEKAMPLQRKILDESSSVEKWDTSLMSLVLLNFGDWGYRYKLPNQAVRKLRDLRNELAHLKSNKYKQSEYNERVTIIKESLQVLEITESEINKLEEESSNTSLLEITERLKLLLDDAEQLIKLRDFLSALQKYSEAIAIPRLPREILGKVYEKRADCYLNKIKNINPASGGKAVDQAILDVKEALKLNGNSWNAHYLNAQCSRAKNNLTEAIHYCEMASDPAICPEHVKPQIKEYLDSCQLDINRHGANSRINCEQLPCTVNDVLGDLAESLDESRRNLTFKEFQKLTDSKNDPVNCGDYYYYGWGGQENYTKAVKYFKRADKEGFALGTYKLGLCYIRGHGVKQDFGKAFEIYSRCAGMEARKGTPLDHFTPLGFNRGVCYAMHAIGECYHKGVAALEKNMSEAVYWYKKAMEFGHAPAALALGILYNEGNNELPMNKKMAEMCWKQALQLGKGNNSVAMAAECLVTYYCEQLEPELGWVMFRIAREKGHWKYGNMSDKQFDEQLTFVQFERCIVEECVFEFENQYNVDSKGMTLRQRFERVRNYDSSNVAMVVPHLKSLLELKEYLESPVRKGLIIQHRERATDSIKLNQKGRLDDADVVPWKLKQTRAQNITPITLQEMDPTKDNIYEDRILDLTIIEEPNVYSNSIQLVAEDENGDTTRVYVDPLTVDPNVLSQRFAVGSRIAVMNPYMGHCALNDVYGIRINELKCVMFLEKVEKMCRFCGEENCTKRCSKCKRLYCSSECLDLDLEIFQHKLICTTTTSTRKGSNTCNSKK